MTWAGFAVNRTLEIAFLEGKQDKYKYQDLLKVYLLPEWIFQQDNAPAHRANDTKKTVVWGSRSPCFGLASCWSRFKPN